MGFARDRLYYFTLILFTNSIFITYVWGDWNEDYLNNSFLLIEAINCFGEPNNQYKNHLIKSQEFQSDIESNALGQELAQLRPRDKKAYFTEEYVVKKRPNRNLNDSLFWEFSIILSLNDYVTPSFPFEFGNNIVIVQPFENLKVGSWIANITPRRTDKVSLRDYFYAHILAFLLGAQDLSGMNIGLTLKNNIRFFDNEDIFGFELVPYKTNFSFIFPFVSVAFDWTQYREKLNETLAHELREFVSSLTERKNELWAYANIRGVSEKIISGICQRIDVLDAFELQEGLAFVDFIQFLCPQLSAGLDELNDIVSEILHRKVDHGIALFFATRMIKYWKVASQHKKRLDSWIERYIY